MSGMAYPKLLSSVDILKTAIRMVEQGDADGLSLRAVALALGVKAPSLYRYFPHKEALEVAIAEEVLSAMRAELQTASECPDPDTRFRETVDAYLRFARERFALYSLIVQNRLPGTYGSKAGKAVWNLLLDAASGISGQRDDTAAAVATWSFLHGYATLEHSGAFGASGPRGGLERGVEAFLVNFRKSNSVPPVRDKTSMRATGVRRQTKSRARISPADATKSQSRK
jgi:AcrR family transcriptional regulator